MSSADDKGLGGRIQGLEKGRGFEISCFLLQKTVDKLPRRYGSWLLAEGTRACIFVRAASDIFCDFFKLTFVVIFCVLCYAIINM